jgi:site-specific DNA-methyltransferase (adenine-specific)
MNTDIENIKETATNTEAHPVKLSTWLGCAQKPYYEDESVVLYHADNRDVLPLCKPMILVTDPPYPNYLTEEYGYYDGILEQFRNWKTRQLIFWTVTQDFPLEFTARHTWDKITGTYANREYIYERNGEIEERTFRYQKIGNIIDAQMNRDILTDHPSRKPIRLLKDIVNRFTEMGDIILDPWSGTGTSLVAAKRLRRLAIGIEIEERYCEITAKRLLQNEMQFE